MSEITKPILLDETGQAIVEALLSVKSAIENQNGGTWVPLPVYAGEVEDL